ncbi:hypothetical protein HRbin12_01334 [bacterium HR12]|nr:hypothetical protein HRbin12_01334 [bacterium HR12]
MAGIVNLDAGDVRTFENGMAQIAKTGTITVSRLTLQPGWRWSNDVRPLGRRTRAWSTTRASRCPAGSTS